MKQFLSILLLFATVAAAQTTGGSVEGQVVATTDGKGIRKARVTLIPARVESDTRPVTAKDSYLTETDSAGHFAISGVVPGTYECVPSRVGYDSKPVSEFASTAYFPHITVTDGQRLEGVALRLTPLGVISGRVVDSEGFPISHAEVAAMQYGYVAGKQQLFVRQQSESNDRGEYRLFNLFPGSYYLRANMREQMPFNGTQIQGPKPEPYTTTYYPGLLDSAQARSVDVAAGGESRSIDVRMQKRPLYSIRGQLPPNPAENGRGGASMITTYNGLGGGGQPMMMRMGAGYQVSVVRRPPDPNFQGGFGFSINNTSFEVPGLPSGSYMLTVMQSDPENPGSSRVARAFVDVIDHDVEGVDLSFAPALEISGVVKVAGNAPVQTERLRVNLESVEQGPQSNAPVLADGTFAVKNVLPDLYRVKVMSPMVYITSIKSENQELPQGQLDLRRHGGGALTVTVSGDMGRVEGTVTDDDGKPAPTINVTMIPDQDKADWHDRFQNRVTDAQGKFTFPALVPGHYTVFAWKDAQRGAPQDPEFRKPFEKLGISMTVEAGGRQTIDLKQIDAKKPPAQ